MKIEAIQWRRRQLKWRNNRRKEEINLRKRKAAISNGIEKLVKRRERSYNAMKRNETSEEIMTKL